MFKNFIAKKVIFEPSFSHNWLLYFLLFQRKKYLKLCEGNEINSIQNFWKSNFLHILHISGVDKSLLVNLWFSKLLYLVHRLLFKRRRKTSKQRVVGQTDKRKTEIRFFTKRIFNYFRIFQGSLGLESKNKFTIIDRNVLMSV